MNKNFKEIKKIKKITKIKKINKIILVSTGLLFLTGIISGCATQNKSFECPDTGGVTCKRLDEVNDMVNDGQIGIGNHSNSTKPESSFDSVNLNNSIRVWLAPYVDSDGNSHQESYMSLSDTHLRIHPNHCKSSNI